MISKGSLSQSMASKNKSGSLNCAWALNKALFLSQWAILLLFWQFLPVIALDSPSIKHLFDTGNCWLFNKKENKPPGQAGEVFWQTDRQTTLLIPFGVSAREINTSNYAKEKSPHSLNFYPFRICKKKRGGLKCWEILRFVNFFFLICKPVPLFFEDNEMLQLKKQNKTDQNPQKHLKWLCNQV